MWQNIKREPVRWLAGFQVAWIAIINGLIIFEAWDPSAEQLQFILGVPLVLANVFGFSIVRDAVTPNTKLSDATLARAAADKGYSLIEVVVLVVLVVLAFFGLVYFFGR